MAKRFEQRENPLRIDPSQIQEGIRLVNIVALYCIPDDLLKAIGHRDEGRRQLPDAEVIPTALTAALYFGGNLEAARRLLRQTGLLPALLSTSRLCRRLHQVEELLVSLFQQLGECFKQANASRQYWLDSFAVELCDNIRSRRCRLARGERWRGKCAAKRRSF